MMPCILAPLIVPDTVGFHSISLRVRVIHVVSTFSCRRCARALGPAAHCRYAPQHSLIH